MKTSGFLWPFFWTFCLHKTCQEKKSFVALVQEWRHPVFMTFFPTFCLNKTCKESFVASVQEWRHCSGHALEIRFGSSRQEIRFISRCVSASSQSLDTSQHLVFGLIPLIPRPLVLGRFCMIWKINVWRRRLEKEKEVDGQLSNQKKVIYLCCTLQNAIFTSTFFSHKIVPVSGRFCLTFGS